MKKYTPKTITIEIIERQVNEFHKHDNEIISECNRLGAKIDPEILHHLRSVVPDESVESGRTIAQCVRPILHRSYGWQFKA